MTYQKPVIVLAGSAACVNSRDETSGRLLGHEPDETPNRGRIRS